MRRLWFFRPWRILVLTLLLAAPPGYAVDSVLLRNGTRLDGKIYAQSKNQVFMRVGQGNVVLSKKAIRRIYEDITDQPPLTRVLPPDELPPWWIPLADLYGEDWVNRLALASSVENDGEFQGVPSLTFEANSLYRLEIFGDPKNPAGLAMSFGPRVPFWDLRAARIRCKRFLASYLPGLKQFETLYRMSDRGGRKEVEGLIVEITPRTLLGRWRVAIWNPRLLAAARLRDQAAWEAANARHLALVKRSTGDETEWTKYSLQDAAKRFLPLERMEER